MTQEANQFKFRQWAELNTNEKIALKQHFINRHGKRFHTRKPNALSVLNELQIHHILSITYSSEI
jgi:hypothetical protein